MPESAHKEGDHVGRHRHHHPIFGDGQTVEQRNDRFEDVNTQKSGKSDVPTLPKLRNIGRKIGIVEVFGRADAHHVGHADGHVAIAGEVDVDVEGIEQCRRNHRAPRSELRQKHLIINSIRLNQRHYQQGFHGPDEDASDTCHQHPLVKAHVSGVQPVMEIVERVDGTGHEGREEEEVVEVGQRVARAQRPFVTLYQPMNHAKEDVRESEFLDRKEMFGERVGPPISQPRLHQRIVAHGEEGEQQRQRQCQHPTRFPSVKKDSCTVCQQCQQEKQKQRLRRHYLRQNQNVTTNQQQIIEPILL